MIADGRITDAKTIIGLTLVARRHPALTHGAPDAVDRRGGAAPARRRRTS